jgi:hypothetical protein
MPVAASADVNTLAATAAIAKAAAKIDTTCDVLEIILRFAAIGC